LHKKTLGRKSIGASSSSPSVRKRGGIVFDSGKQRLMLNTPSNYHKHHSPGEEVEDEEGEQSPMLERI
jgi:hypothetical protein